MDIFLRTARYLERALGCAIQLSPMPKAELKGLPLFLTERYALRQWKWQGKMLCLALFDDVEMDALTPSQISKDIGHLADVINLQVILVLKATTPYQRTRLIQSGTPFIVPESQMFIPPFLDLTESFRRIKTATKLSGTAQFMLLHQLLRKPNEALPIKEWARISARSAVMASKAYAELVEHGLCEGSSMKRNRKGILFTANGAELWQAAQPFLRSPAAKRLWVRFQHPTGKPKRILDAGMTALDKKTMLSDDPIPTGACSTETFKMLTDGKHIVVCEDSDLASMRLECWLYDPCRLSEDSKTVDVLSLWLSLADSGDERVEQAREQLLEGFKW